VVLAICWHSAACFRNSSGGLIGVMDAHFLVSRPLLDTIQMADQDGQPALDTIKPQRGPLARFWAPLTKLARKGPGESGPPRP
jgi:hypothetical protein